MWTCWRGAPIQVACCSSNVTTYSTGKSEGEIAEQVADFRGEVKADGKPDLLLKHLNRVALITKHPDEVANYVGVKQPFVIEGHLVFRNPAPMRYAATRL